MGVRAGGVGPDRCEAAARSGGATRNGRRENPTAASGCFTEVVYLGGAGRASGRVPVAGRLVTVALGSRLGGLDHRESGKRRLSRHRGGGVARGGGHVNEGARAGRADRCGADVVHGRPARSEGAPAVGVPPGTFPADPWDHDRPSRVNCFSEGTKEVAKDPAVNGSIGPGARYPFGRRWTPHPSP